MGTEIERKFIVDGRGWRVGPGVEIEQGYLSAEPVTVRVRSTGERAWLTVKARAGGIARHEFEYEIPSEDARFMLDELCADAKIEKTRYEVAFMDRLWQVDEFRGANSGLVLAEIELAAENEDFPRPDWLGPEVTGDERYLNVNLAIRPFRDW